MSETKERVFEYLQEVKDPEVPVISVVELGIVRDAVVSGDRVEVTVTPTYSGCPAMQVIEREIVTALEGRGFRDVQIRTVLSPAWTTDWISEKARQKLKEYGIAPPGTQPSDVVPFPKKSEAVACPFCDSKNTRVTSEFGATACKALHYCDSCEQPFERFKTF